MDVLTPLNDLQAIDAAAMPAMFKKLKSPEVVVAAGLDVAA